ncbi:UNVERIFIED_CONTAM: hypothetical protein GTU68_008865 [Idotea baltica]|nr:hypothetical protein [Idotea baltica]
MTKNGVFPFITMVPYSNF